MVLFFGVVLSVVQFGVLPLELFNPGFSDTLPIKNRGKPWSPSALRRSAQNIPGPPILNLS